MKLLLAVLIGMLLLCVCVNTQAEGWSLDLKLHQFAGFMDTTQRLTKDLGGVDLMLGARQFKLDGKHSNHLNLMLRGDWFGIEYLSGENVTADLRAFSLFAPGSAKAKDFATPCDSVLHTYLHKEFASGFVQFDWFKKSAGTSALDEMQVHARAEF